MNQSTDAMRPRAGWQLFVVRKLCHLLFAGITAVLFLATRSGPTIDRNMVMVAGLYGLVLIVIDITIRPWYFTCVSRDSRPRLVGSLTWGVLGCSAAFFIGGPERAALAAVLLGVGDAAAGIGSCFLHPIPLPFNRRKSVQGSLISLVACLGVSAIWAPHLPGFSMAVGACLAESVSNTWDDNLAMPVTATIVGRVVSAISHL